MQNRKKGLYLSLLRDFRRPGKRSPRQVRFIPKNMPFKADESLFIGFACHAKPTNRPVIGFACHSRPANRPFIGFACHSRPVNRPFIGFAWHVKPRFKGKS
jgi:hypothetical protein